MKSKETRRHRVDARRDKLSNVMAKAAVRVVVPRGACADHKTTRLR